MIEAARKYKRIVQHGTQSRSFQGVRAAADFVRSGKLGKVTLPAPWCARGAAPSASAPRNCRCRTGRAFEVDFKSETVLGDKEANALHCAGETITRCGA